MPAAGAPFDVDVPLETGTLGLRIDRSDWTLDSLCGFALRRNPRRPFLIVSKVLGRHIPARPRAMRASVRDLAAKLPADIPEPVLVLGLAETAICLGQSVQAELHRLGRNAAFLHSTRQETDAPLLCRFEEPHSHASDHLVYRPPAIDLRKIRSLLLVDDEISTGTTLRNAAEALIPALPLCERIVVATLSDWSAKAEWLGKMPRAAEVVSLLEGRLRWTSSGAAKADTGESGFDQRAQALGKLPAAGPFGRLGTTGSANFPLPDVSNLGLVPGQGLRIVGTGEFTYPPFLLAERLEGAGYDVVMQATSRSPVRLGGAVRDALAFEDNYGSGVPNFLYNAKRGDGRLTLVCHETPPGTVDPSLLKALDARPVYFGG
jgi:hypothetical protein